MNAAVRLLIAALACATLASCAGLWPASAPPSPPSPVPVTPPPAKPVEAARPLRIGLALGGGAARGFAHIGVIKVLEQQGIVPDVVVGTSAGSLVGSLYAAGFNGFELNRLALSMDESTLADWALPARGLLKGEALQSYVNRIVHNRPIEQFKKPFAAVSTDLHTGDMILFQRGNAGMAVRASSSVPGVFQPVTIGGHEYVDGGLVSPVPVRAARKLGADFVIAVDLSAQPGAQPTNDTMDVLLQTFAIMGASIKHYELQEADVVIRPALGAARGTDFQSRYAVILAGEQAATQAMSELKAKLEAKRLRTQ